MSLIFLASTCSRLFKALSPVISTNHFIYVISILFSTLSLYYICLFSLKNYK